MFWNDIKSIKEWMVTIAARLSEMQMKHLQKDDSEEALAETLDNLDYKINSLISDTHQMSQVYVAEKTLDKFDDYMKNVDKLNLMINEFKGCVSVARASISDKKEMDEMKTVLKNMIDTCQKYFNHQKTISDQYFKIDAIYKEICEKTVEKPKKKVIRKKKTVTSA